jgi:hypothetical protein
MWNPFSIPLSAYADESTLSDAIGYDFSLNDDAVKAHSLEN